MTLRRFFRQCRFEASMATISSQQGSDIDNLPAGQYWSVAALVCVG